ncbi:MAG: hypothetical protein RSC76_09645, partial [Oscillospiraceae bacterium]
MNDFPEFQEAIERSKELECLYRVEEALSCDNLKEAFLEVSKVLPSGFSDYQNCTVSVIADGKRYDANPVPSDSRVLTVEILVNQQSRGQIIAAYPKNVQSRFLPQEKKLLQSIANKIGNSLRQMELVPAEYAKINWQEIIKLLQSSNHQLLLHVCEKMLSLFATHFPQKVESIFAEFGWAGYNYSSEGNISLENMPQIDILTFSNRVFAFAQINFSDALIYEHVNQWI